jgi:uncharacterized protein
LLVVSDTTAITSLLKIGQFEILLKLFNEVVIAEAVRDELLRYHASIPANLGIKAVKDKGLLSALLERLEAGEAESITLASELKADALLIDERRGRKMAEQRGIFCLGLAGIALLAKRKGVLASVAGFLDNLEKDARFYLSADVKREVLLKARE